MINTNENQKRTLTICPKSHPEQVVQGKLRTGQPSHDMGGAALPWDQEFLPKKPRGSDYGYVKGSKLIPCTREELTELCKGAGINSTEIHLAWTPETGHAIPVEQIPFLFQSIVDKRRKSARWTLLNSAIWGGLIIGHNYSELNLRHLTVFLTLATVLPMFFGFRSLRAAEALTPEKLAQEVAENQWPFQLWVGMQRAHFTLGLVLLCSMVTLMELVALAFEGSADTAAIVKPAVFAGEWWRLLTGVFVHAGLMHLMFNAVGLGVFGHWLEVVIGRMFVPVVFLLTAFTGSLFSLYFSAEPSVGASGGILGLAGFLFTASRRPSALPLKDVRMTVATTACFTAFIGMVAYDLFDTAAHLGGLLSGLALGALVKNPKALAGSRTFQLCGITSCLVLCAGALLAMYLMTIPVW